MRVDRGCCTGRRASWVMLIALGMLLRLFTPSPASAQTPLYLENFSQAAPQGFGSVHNSMARASTWWNGQLFVGTSREHGCSQAAILKLYIPLRSYPPPDTSLHCAPDPR